MLKKALKRTILAAFAIMAAVMPRPEACAQTRIEPIREFRAAWVATVANIDWPSSRELTSREQQAELIRILDTAVDLNLNAIIFQVRPMGDALYASRIDPWSGFLTGRMGKAPSPFWDPLEFAIEESHKRGLELHAWINPYRAKHPSFRGEISVDHVSRRHPTIVREYGAYLWLDPTDERTKTYTFNIVRDIIRRYNVDGIHYDDYFYPYPYYAGGADFPDQANWERYRRGGGRMSREDWRRDHVNDFVRRLYDIVKKEDPAVRVGISPFGIWRPDHPPGIEGMDQYEVLYADARRWLNEGWLDYFTPQLYWPIDQAPQSYPRLLSWWVGENKKNRHVWPGNFISKVTNQSDSWAPEEIVNQIRVTRQQAGATGNVHFSMIALLENRRNLGAMLKNGPYAEPALVPASPWLGNRPPSQPRAGIRRLPGGGHEVTWVSRPDDDLRLWAVYRRIGGRDWKMQIVPAHNIRSSSVRIPANAGITDVAISAVDRLGNESSRTLLRVH